MTNKYPGKCVECRQNVSKGSGEARKSKKGHWYVLCSEHAGDGKLAPPVPTLPLMRDQEGDTAKDRVLSWCNAQPRVTGMREAGPDRRPNVPGRYVIPLGIWGETAKDVIAGGDTWEAVEAALLERDPDEPDPFLRISSSYSVPCS